MKKIEALLMIFGIVGFLCLIIGIVELTTRNTRNTRNNLEEQFLEKSEIVLRAKTKYMTAQKELDNFLAEHPEFIEVK